MGRRRLLRRQLNNAAGLSAGDVLVEFAIIIERHSDIFLELPSEDETQFSLGQSSEDEEQQGLSAAVIVVIAICTTLAAILVALVIVLVYRKRAAKRDRVRTFGKEITTPKATLKE